MDRSEFEHLVRQCWPVIRSVARRFDSGAGVDDICQDTVLVAWRRRETVRDPAAFPAWVRTIALNVGRAHSRRRQTRLGPFQEDDAVSPDPAGAVADGDAIRCALDSLEERERLVVEAHHLYGWSLTDLAAALREPVGTTKSRLSRARGKLRRELNRQGWTRLGRAQGKEERNEPDPGS